MIKSIKEVKILNNFNVEGKNRTPYIIIDVLDNDIIRILFNKKRLFRTLSKAGHIQEQLDANLLEIMGEILKKLSDKEELMENEKNFLLNKEVEK